MKSKIVVIAFNQSITSPKELLSIADFAFFKRF